MSAEIAHDVWIWLGKALRVYAFYKIAQHVTGQPTPAAPNEGLYTKLKRQFFNLFVVAPNDYLPAQLVAGGVTLGGLHGMSQHKFTQLWNELEPAGQAFLTPIMEKLFNSTMDRVISKEIVFTPEKINEMIRSIAEQDAAVMKEMIRVAESHAFATDKIGKIGQFLQLSDLEAKAMLEQAQASSSSSWIPRFLRFGAAAATDDAQIKALQSIFSNTTHAIAQELSHLNQVMLQNFTMPVTPSIPGQFLVRNVTIPHVATTPLAAAFPETNTSWIPGSYDELLERLAQLTASDFGKSTAEALDTAYHWGSRLASVPVDLMAGVYAFSKASKIPLGVVLSASALLTAFGTYKLISGCTRNTNTAHGGSATAHAHGGAATAHGTAGATAHGGTAHGGAAQGGQVHN
ncbi:MAG: hypothetical protein ACHQUC_07850, partial [Chlamydiales bacterium]